MVSRTRRTDRRPRFAGVAAAAKSGIADGRLAHASSPLPPSRGGGLFAACRRDDDGRRPIVRVAAIVV
jgi:hypothetical protein